MVGQIVHVLQVSGGVPWEQTTDAMLPGLVEVARTWHAVFGVMPPAPFGPAYEELEGKLLGRYIETWTTLHPRLVELNLHGTLAQAVSADPWPLDNFFRPGKLFRPANGAARRIVELQGSSVLFQVDGEDGTLSKSISVEDFIAWLHENGVEEEGHS